jgi:hypothetical protein
MEMQRLGGLLRVLSDEKTHSEIERRMREIADKYNLWIEYDSLYISYEDLFSCYNSDLLWN